MLKNLFLAGLAAAVVAGVGYANQSTAKTVIIPVSKAPANNGRQMYVNYCAPCHGVDGKGNGPAAAALKKQPTNLAVLSRNNGGKFPSTHIASVLQFGTANPVARLGGNAAVGTRAWVRGFRSERSRRAERSESAT